MCYLYTVYHVYVGDTQGKKRGSGKWLRTAAYMSSSAKDKRKKDAGDHFWGDDQDKHGKQE